MEYENETWRLPLPKGKEKHIKSKPLQMSNPYAPLRHLTEQDDQDELNSSSDVDQARFELQRKREREVSILHDVSHRHNRGLLEDLKAAGVETKHNTFLHTGANGVRQIVENERTELQHDRRSLPL